MNKHKSNRGGAAAFSGDTLVKEMSARAKHFSSGSAEGEMFALCPKASCQPGCEQGCEKKCQTSCKEGNK